MKITFFPIAAILEQKSSLCEKKNAVFVYSNISIRSRDIRLLVLIDSTEMCFLYNY